MKGKVGNVGFRFLDSVRRRFVKMRVFVCGSEFRGRVFFLDETWICTLLF